MAIDHDILVRALLTERIKVIAFVRAIVRKRELAEDVFQDVCVIALEKREQIHDAQHLAAWLRTTARLRAMNVLRKQKNRLEPLDDAVLDSMESHWRQHDPTAGSAMSEALQKCLEQLAEKARQVIHSRYTQGLSVAELADRSNRTVNSMYVAISRIHATLSDCVFRRLAAERSRPDA